MDKANLYVRLDEIGYLKNLLLKQSLKIWWIEKDKNQI